MSKPESQSKPSKPLGAPQGTMTRRVFPKTPTREETPVIIHTLKKENYPERSRTALPDPYPELSEKSKAYLKLWPYGTNLLVSKSDLATLQQFYLAIKDIPLPDSLIPHFEKQHNLLRKALGLIPLEDLEAKWKEESSNFSTQPKYICKCFKTRKRKS